MGIFSIFKKKQDQDDGTGLPDLSGLPTRSGEPSRLAPQLSEAERRRHREVARATAMKIDAIESAMTRDIFESGDAAWAGKRAPRPVFTNDAAGPHPTLPMLELATTELLGEDDVPEALHDAETAPVIEEAAILYANGQAEATEQLLRDSLADGGQTDRNVWWMLFDLLQLAGRQDAFDDLAIAYAGRFETSPPAWSTDGPPAADSQPRTEVFPLMLDGAIAPQLARMRALADAAAVLVLDVSNVRAVTPDGCALLLDALRAVRVAGRTLSMLGAAELAVLVRATLAVGRRDASPAPWLLRLELLQLLHEEKDFEEAAMDYCITYEVSPPSYEPPGDAAAPPPAQAADCVTLPVLLDGDIGPLLAAIGQHAAHHNPLVLDCAQLARVDYHAAGQLLEALRPLAGAGHMIEMRDLNHLVAALLRLLGFAGLVRLYPHKY